MGKKSENLVWMFPSYAYSPTEHAEAAHLHERTGRMVCNPYSKMNEWMKWLLIYRLSFGQWPDLKAVHSTYHRLTDKLPTWVEKSKDTCSWSTSSFPTIIYLGSIISFLSLSLHLNKIVDGLYFHCSLSVCVSVCVSVCPALLVNKSPAEQIHRFGRGFR